MELSDSSFDFDDAHLGRCTTPPKSLHTTVSPPPTRRRKQPPASEVDDASQKLSSLPASSLVEAGNVRINDHLTYWTNHLSSGLIGNPPLPLDAFKDLYTESAGKETGKHFVVHQHDHPVAGLHYDLRLQINKTSSASWAIMYGLPGNANSKRINRNATETRVHCLWVGG